jgi:hypothetical protein
MSRASHLLGNRFADGFEVVSVMRRPLFTPRKIPDTYFCWRLSRPQAQIAAGRIRSIEKFSDLIWNRVRNFPTSIILLQAATLPLCKTVICPEQNYHLKACCADDDKLRLLDMRMRPYTCPDNRIRNIGLIRYRTESLTFVIP